MKINENTRDDSERKGVHSGSRRRIMGTGIGAVVGAALLPMAARAQPAQSAPEGSRAEPLPAASAPNGSAGACGAGPAPMEVRPGVAIAYEDQYFGAPWLKPETIVLIHGNGESALAWTQWVGPLSTNYRVIRPDIPGFGRSPAPASYSWSPADIAKDIGTLLTKLGIDRFHLVGAKYGGSVAVELACDQPARVITLSAFATPLKSNPGGNSKDLTTLPDEIAKLGVRNWAAQTQRSRLGSKVPEAQIQWWTDTLMEGVEPRVLIGATGAAAQMDLEPRLGEITAPTMVVTTEGSGLQTVANVQRYSKLIPHSILLTMPGDSYHVAASNPIECAHHVLSFIEKGRVG